MVMRMLRNSKTIRERQKVGVQNEMSPQNANLENLSCWSGKKNVMGFM
jgi:hypothetical protein